MQTVPATVFAIVRNDENVLMSAPDNYSFLPLAGDWKLAVLNEEVYGMLANNDHKEFGVTYSPEAEKAFGYIDPELTTISLEKVKRFYVKPTAAHFLGLMMGWTMVGDDGKTFNDDDGDNWTLVEDECWHGDIDSVILNLVMPKDGGGACGCGDNAGAVVALGKFLETQMNHPVNTADESRQKARQEGLYVDGLLGSSQLFIAYVVDAAGFTEHGGSVFHGWLQLKGVYLAFLIAESIKLTAEINAD
ncbi:hypothetical protein D3C71_1467080 [compost metagenome]